MIEQIKVSDSIYYVGVNDRSKPLFENLWPLPYGVSYNAYLIVDEKVTLVDTVDICYSEQFFRQIERIIGDRPIDYLIINHMEPDHSGSIGMLKLRYPNISIIGNKVTFRMFKSYYEDINDNLVVVGEGDKLNVGSRELTFVMAPMVHWPEVMFTYDSKEKVLFSADAFGTFGTLDGNVMDYSTNLDHYLDEMERYYSCIVGKYGKPVQKVLGRLKDIDVKTICSTHGPVWTDFAFDKAFEIYDRLSRYQGQKGALVLYGSMYGNTGVVADYVARGIGSRGIKDVVCHDVSRVDPSYVLRDLFRYKAFAVGSPTYSNEIYPPIQNILNMIKIREVPDRIMGIFGSCSWAGQAVRKLTPFAEEMKWELIGQPIEQMGTPGEDDLKKAYELGQLIGDRLNELFPEEA